MLDHVHMMISIPPKYAVSQMVGFIKGKSAIHLAWVYGERKRNFVGQHFWAKGVLRLHRGPRRGGGTRIYPQPAKGKPASRAVEPLAHLCPVDYKPSQTSTTEGLGHDRRLPACPPMLEERSIADERLRWGSLPLNFEHAQVGRRLRPRVTAAAFEAAI